ncbi:MAG: GH3 auxin-responsive promoter family protein, partial [Ktedonobacterales bacterium]
WSMTPVGERMSHTSGGSPIGFDDEQEYFSPLTRWVLNSIMAGSSQLAQLSDMEVFRYVTLRLLLQERFLCWVSVWNPSFLTLLLDPLAEWLPQLSQDIRQGTLAVAAQIELPLRERILSRCTRSPARAHELERLNASWRSRPATEVDSAGWTLYEAIWPHLRLISCWAHGNAALALSGLQTCFPHAAIQPKGLLATEAFISFPFTGDLSALSLLSHFYEFEEAGEAAPGIRLAHELQVGRQYSVIVTTGGGLYRYRLNDLIEVADFYHECPLIRFVGRQSKVVDICGEKLNEDFVHAQVAGLLAERALTAAFWMMAPVCPSAARPFYTLFIQFDAGIVPTKDQLHTLAKALDEALKESYHYEYSRRLGQLESCRLFVIVSQSNGYHTYLAVCADLGQRLGEIKPTALHAYQHWSQRFTGNFIDQ